MAISTIQQLTNSGSKAMNVNGGTPKTFSYSPSTPAEITGFICILRSEGTTSLSNFGAISALTNGVLLQVTQGGTTRTIATIKDNADLCTTFHFNQFGNSAVLSILSVVTPEGFGNSTNVFVGYYEFDASIILQSGDSISAVIQDNLSSINNFQMSCKVNLD